MKKVILEYNFTFHQKNILALCVGMPIAVSILLTLTSNINSSDYLILAVLIFLFLVFISITFLRCGFIKIEGDLWIGYFFGNTLLFKQKIDISKASKIVTLKSKKQQKLAWISEAKPDMSTDYYSYKIYVLNGNHSRRKAIIELRRKKSIKKAIEFLTENFDLVFEKYDPRAR